VLFAAVFWLQGISDIITVPGLINVDFADVKAIISNAGEPAAAAAAADCLKCADTPTAAALDHA
jgi:cell division GTPase FtsZ